MMRIAHISDTHFGTEIPEVVAALQAAIAQIQPEIIILSGDITQRARKDQFARAAAFMASLPAETKLVIPGNHDIPLYNLFARFGAPYANYIKAFGRRRQRWSGGGITIVCYDATAPWRHTRGKLARAALLQYLPRNKAAGDILIACAHQPLVTAWPEDADETLIGRKKIARLWSEYRVDLALSGHVHVPIITTTADAFPDLPYPFILAGAGTAVSHRVRPGAPNSFNLIECGRQDNIKNISITLHEYNPAQNQFAAAPSINFTCGEHGWKRDAADDEEK